MDWVDRLKERLAELGLSYEEFAEKIGMTPGAVSHWITRRRIPDKLTTFDLIAKGIDRSTAWLLYGVEQSAQQDVAAYIADKVRSQPEPDQEKIKRMVDAFISPPANHDHPPTSAVRSKRKPNL